MKQVVAALIFRRGRLLICQRTKYQTMPLKWEFPGGKIESGEQPRDALRRELDEELGIDAVIGEEIARIKHCYRGKNAAVELRFYVVHEWRGEIENRIFRAVRWVRPADLLRHDFLDADHKLVKDLAAGNLEQVAFSKELKSKSSPKTPGGSARLPKKPA
jgi:8-oxo-dGTP diphosphatase